ncbi:hypothetical protein DDN98_17390 [Vibrio cholerae]|uniref:hypothetical protein n=1 Tax=Vibrio cholerae TaxID=666 RepID=UPI0007C54CCF|nr:hypothetical protein [Vibrio cholerae]EGR2105446.1 hypothetical protein [Vibrio cholerae]EGR4295563.1 hypothetical protein [Vibrio cholerae]EGR4299475.1 hypothetical protein [Vibrio cholerae]ELY5178956.1 hypothetical protein [Vibrio cholerae]KAA1217136.1 hypothetical protein F0Q05_07045 [Vibrio cholerae]
MSEAALTIRDLEERSKVILRRELNKRKVDLSEHLIYQANASMDEIRITQGKIQALIALIEDLN